MISLKKILMARECPRKHEGKYAHRLPDPMHPNAQEGIDFHSVCENWLASQRLACKTKFGLADVLPESHLGKLALAALQFAPRGALPEVSQLFQLFGRTVQFKIDALAPQWEHFWDWKKSSGPRWELTDETLAKDMQFHFQAYGMMQASGRTVMSATWVYVDKKTYKTRPAKASTTLGESEAFLREHALPAMKQIEFYESIQPTPAFHSVPHDITACGGTGHFCNFYGRCQMIPAPLDLVQLRTVMKG